MIAREGGLYFSCQILSHFLSQSLFSMNEEHQLFDREPAVAGQFYPFKPEILQKELKTLFAAAIPKQCEHVRAIISPHAGYVFSGEVAASSFNQIDTGVHYERVFLLASSHQARFEGASVYCEGDFLMPYGKEEVDCDFGMALVKEHPDLFSKDKYPHRGEHSIEVQLPFLHYVLKKKYKIVPILLGTVHPMLCKRIAAVLKPWLNANNLFVISTDFSHYPDYEHAKSVDAITEQAILSNDPEHLVATLKENANREIPQLFTSLCGWTSVLTLLYMTAHEENYQYHPIQYKNSGDAGIHGDLDRVVGYCSIAVTENKKEKEEFSLTDQEKQLLLQEARQTLERLFGNTSQPPLKSNDCSGGLIARCGAFVTLHHHGRLRGCCGMMMSDKPLIQTIQAMAVSSAKHDYRFPPLTERELPEIDLEISVLSPLRKISDISEIEMGVHGIYIEQDSASGVFLPQVATETGWDKETFLGHCARDKAGIGWEGWKSADIYIFTATIFAEKE